MAVLTIEEGKTYCYYRHEDDLQQLLAAMILVKKGPEWTVNGVLCLIEIGPIAYLDASGASYQKVTYAAENRPMYGTHQVFTDEAAARKDKAARLRKQAAELREQADTMECA